MNINNIINKLLSNQFSVSYKNGIKHFNLGNVKYIEIKNTNNYFNIYGKIQDKVRTYNSQVRINNNTSKVELICNCEFSKEVRSMRADIPCEHIVAMLLEYTKENSIVNTSKLPIKFILRLEESHKDSYKYNAVLFLEGAGRIKIDSKSSLQNYMFTKESPFFISKNSYSKDNIKIIQLLQNSDFKIKSNDLRRLFELCLDVNLSIKIDAIEYKPKIKKEMMPIIFTLKLQENKIKLQTLKTKVLSLDDEATVFLFENNIYLPELNICRTYKSVYKVFSKKSYTFIKRQGLEKVISILKQVGKLNIHDEIKNMLAQNYKSELYFDKDNQSIYCKIIIPKEYEYLDKTDNIKIIQEILYANKFTKKENKYYFVGNDDNLFNILHSNLSNICSFKSSNKIGLFKIINSKDLSINIQKSHNNISVLIEEDFDESEWSKAIESFGAGANYYRFDNYSFLDYTDSETIKFMEFLQFIDYKGVQKNLPIGYEDAINYIVEKQNTIDIMEKTKTKEIKILQKPRDLNAQLRDYQKEGLSWLQDKKEKGLFGILADDMGLGKTIQAISFILMNKKEKVMVVTPASLVYNWQQEFTKFAPSLKVAYIYGNKDKRTQIINDSKNYNVLLTSYGALNMDIDLYENLCFDILIIDEAQVIKNSKSKISSNIKKVNSKTKFALTGTPIENNYLEIWNIFDFLCIGYLFSEKNFKNKFLNKDKGIDYLKRIINPFILRRTKSEVLKELPDKIQRTYYVDMTKEQAKYYKSSLTQIIKDIKNNKSNSICLLSYLTKLRQIALDPHIIDDKYKGGSGKIDRTIEIINKCIENNKKILIFSQFTSLLEKLKNEIHNFKYYYLDGNTKASDRVKMCNEFNKSTDTNIFLISLKAGGTGLNLTSAEVVIHFDPWWNPAVENQATDRAHRIGQKKQIEVIKIIAKNTIEEKILRLNEQKKEIFDNLICESDKDIQDISKISQKELEELLLK